MLKDITYKEDYKLVDEYMSGNKNSGEQLYAKVFEMLPGFIHNNTAKSILTEDDKQEILEETLSESIEKLWKYDGSCKFTTFVLGFARNKCKEKIRKNENIKIIELYEEKICEEDYSSYNQDPAIIIIRKEEIERINIVISKLSEEDKQIIKLRIIYGMTAKEISDIVGENIEAIYSRYRRAIKRFKKFYEEM